MQSITDVLRRTNHQVKNLIFVSIHDVPLIAAQEMPVEVSDIDLTSQSNDSLIITSITSNDSVSECTSKQNNAVENFLYPRLSQITFVT